MFLFICQVLFPKNINSEDKGIEPSTRRLARVSSPLVPMDATLQVIPSQQHLGRSLGIKASAPPI